jgi:hypothetical protein
MSAVIRRRIAKLEKEHHGQYLTVFDFLQHLDTGEALPDRSVDAKLQDLLDGVMDGKH